MTEVECICNIHCNFRISLCCESNSHVTMQTASHRQQNAKFDSAIKGSCMDDKLDCSYRYMAEIPMLIGYSPWLLSIQYLPS